MQPAERHSLLQGASCWCRLPRLPVQADNAPVTSTASAPGYTMSFYTQPTLECIYQNYHTSTDRLIELQDHVLIALVPCHEAENFRVVASTGTQAADLCVAPPNCLLHCRRKARSDRS